MATSLVVSIAEKKKKLDLSEAFGFALDPVQAQLPALAFNYVKTTLPSALLIQNLIHLLLFHCVNISDLEK